ncbi:MAG: glutamate synthase-related protein [Verrucomicrobiales bacterium]
MSKTLKTATVDLHVIAKIFNLALPALTLLFILAGHFGSCYCHFFSAPLIIHTLFNYLYRHGQKDHTLLANFGLIGQTRYFLESIGPEMRQYLFATDTEERPFNRNERAEVYRKSKGIDSAASFGSQREYDASEIKLRHSMFPVPLDERQPFSLTFGDPEKTDVPYTIHHPTLISAMSYGALSAPAVRALARGARNAGIAMNTGEGGYPKYHFIENCDLIFQIGTAKFGVRDEQGLLDEDKLREIVEKPQVRMVEVKFSQGAKPGKGGLLPKEKISEEIAILRGVGRDRDIVSPPRHLECTDIPSSVAFFKRIQDIARKPTGFKICLGRPSEFRELMRAFKARNVIPDFIAVDGAEGGTGAAPTAFLDGVGVPIYVSLYHVNRILCEEGLRSRIKIIAGGKLITPLRQIIALCIGADACYTARGFMLSMGCIQALQCGNNTCPVGITSHDPQLHHGLDIETKARRVTNYIQGLLHDFDELLAAAGVHSENELNIDHLYIPSGHALHHILDHNRHGSHHSE